MVEPYTAVGLVPTFWGIRRREDIKKNLDHLET
jgi:beta-ureidopropionase